MFTNFRTAAAFNARTQMMTRAAERPMTEAELARVAPSIFAAGKHESRSERFAYIPTADVLRSLQSEGFRPFFATQGRCRIEGKSDFTKHMIRLRHVDHMALGGNRGDEIREIILINAHDGTSAYKMLAGIWRRICSNGLVSSGLIDEVKVKHSGKVVGEVVDGAFRILSHFDQVEASVDAMKAMQLTSGEQEVFARAALAMRYPERELEAAPITTEQVIRARRFEDREDSLWTTFNRAQENLIQGGVQGRVVDGNGRVRRPTTRAVNGIDGNVALNRGLWVLAEEFRKLRGEVAA